MAEGTVCNLCLSRYPDDISLISVKCLHEEEHRYTKRMIQAQWKPPGRLEPVGDTVAATSNVRIRPLPNVSLGNGKRFILCTGGYRCRGERCPFAHSLEEREEWNRMLLSSQSSAPIRRVNSSPQENPLSRQLRPGGRNMPKQRSPNSSSSQILSLQERVDRQLRLEQHSQQQRTPTQDYQHNHFQRKKHPSAPDFSTNPDPLSEAPLHQSVNIPPSQTHPDGFSSQTYLKISPASHSDANPWPSLGLSPQHSPNVSEVPPLGLGTSSISTAQQASTKTAHDQRPDIAVPVQAHVPIMEGVRSFPPTQQQPPSKYFPSPSDVIYEPWMRQNYKRKFTELLKCEENTHSGILRERCKGKYPLVLLQVGLKRPSWIQREFNAAHKRFGYLLGMKSDQIAYAVQAAQDRGGVVIQYQGQDVCEADILQENYTHNENRFYIAFDKEGTEKIWESPYQISKNHCKVDVEVQFELKHAYFRNLQRSVDHIRPDITNRIIPDENSFSYKKSSVDLSKHKHLCSPDQLKALEAIATCLSNGPPVLICGPFGTGKTRTLAIASDYFFSASKLTGRPVRVLVCTQQRASADNFLECYLNLKTNEGDAKIYLIRDYGFHNPNLNRWYLNIQDFKHYYQRNSNRHNTNFLIVTTCLTAPRLDFLQHGFFTHILIDEGAQMREPEAIAPLCLAGENTKIVIAGDQHQVGPAMLVLGEKAQKNGLAISLLERLYSLYKELGDVANNHYITLVTNYRCHPEILKFSGNLFYETSLYPPSNKPLPAAHPSYSYPLVFICSSVDERVTTVDSSTNEAEVQAILDAIAKVSMNWPYSKWGNLDLSQFCIMSPSRSQLTLASQIINSTNRRLRNVRRLPTYDMQGREFRALFLSTHEPTEEDCYPRNPIKSLCDRFVFNTAITRAQSLVVATGNPFLLLKMERPMVCRYGEKGKCFSSYLTSCLKHNTIFFDDALKLSDKDKRKYTSKLVKILTELQDQTKDPNMPVLSQQVHQNQQMPAEIEQSDDVFIADDFPPLRLTGQQVKLAKAQPKPNTQHMPKIALAPNMPVQPQPTETHPLLVGSSPQHETTPQASQDALVSLGQMQSPVEVPRSPHTSQSDQVDVMSPMSAETVDSGLSQATSEGIGMNQENTQAEVQDEGYNTGAKQTATVKTSPTGTSKFETDYENKGVLGQGGFGVVYHVRNKFDHAEYALKVIKLKKDEEKMMKEVRALARLDHPHIVRYFTSWKERAPEGWTESEHWSALQSSQYLTTTSPALARQRTSDSSVPTSPSTDSPNDTIVNQEHSSDRCDDFTVEFAADSSESKADAQSRDSPEQHSVNLSAVVAKSQAQGTTKQEVERPLCLLIQTELCQKDTLRKWLTNNTSGRKRKVVVTYFEQILDALCYIHHKHKLIHRDLKPSNILFAQDDGRLKIGDFGLVTGGVAPDLAAINLSGERQHQHSASSHQVGTYLYISPEQRAGKKCTQKADIYALGVIFFELFCPFKSKHERIKVLSKLREEGIPEEFTKGVPSGVESIAKLLLNHDPSKRPSAEDIQKDDREHLKKLKKSANKKKLVQILSL